MNTTERIAESYFRHCLGCFTMTDVKVAGGNNRQLDIVAVNLVSVESYHAEVSVKIRGFDPTVSELQRVFDRKFSGVPKENNKPGGDFATGKNYLESVSRTYADLGLAPERVQRVFICWRVKAGTEELEEFLAAYSQRHFADAPAIKVWQFWDTVLPQLQAAVGTSNYADDALRTLSLLAAAEREHSRELKRQRSQARTT